MGSLRRRAPGLGTFKTFRLIVFPQAFKTAMPPLTGQFVALLKETVIRSVVGIPELLREALVVQSWTANPTPLIIATIGFLLPAGAADPALPLP
ncbi:MAG: ABC transporter permease subunit [Bilophila wadsworthia]